MSINFSYNSVSVKKRNFVVIFVIYFITHGLLLIVDGRWWDDWCPYNMSSSELWRWCLELGRPSGFPIVKFTQILPESGYRYIVFLIYLLSSILYYDIIKKIFCLSDKTCLYVTLLYITIMTFSSRILLACFSYSLGSFMFLLAFYQLLLIDDNNFKKNIANYIVNILLFFISFILNSNLVLYLIVIIYIIIKKKPKFKLFSVIKISYYINPILYFTGKNILFPAHGAYAGYNSITFDKIKNTIVHITDIYYYNAFKIPLSSYLESQFIYIAIFIVILLLIFDNRNKIIASVRFKQIKKSKDNIFNIYDIEDDNISKNIQLFMYGSLVLLLSVIPYNLIRGSIAISTHGIAGRDSVLISLGLPMITYAIVRTIVGKKVIKYFVAFHVVLGILYFNWWYFQFQRDYYCQVGFQYQLELNNTLKGVDNILYESIGAGIIGNGSVCELNANAELVWGDQRRNFLGSHSLIKKTVVDSEEILERRSSPEWQKRIREQTGHDAVYHRKEWNYNNTRIDAIVQYNCRLSTEDIIILKIYKLLNLKKFKVIILSKTSMKVILYGTPEYTEYVANFK